MIAIPFLAAFYDLFKWGPLIGISKKRGPEPNASLVSP